MRFGSASLKRNRDRQQKPSGEQQSGPTFPIPQYSAVFLPGWSDGCCCVCAKSPMTAERGGGWGGGCPGGSVATFDLFPTDNEQTLNAESC